METKETSKDYLQKLVDYKEFHTLEDTKNTFSLPSRYRLEQLLKLAKEQKIVPTRTNEENEEARTQEVIEALEKAGGNKTKAAQLLGIAISTFKSRLNKAISQGLFSNEDELELKARFLEQENSTLRTELKQFKNQTYALNDVRTKIFNLASTSPSIPNWLVNTNKLGHSAGIPSIFLSDFHWGEVVDPSQINNVNQYNLEIAKKRVQALVEKTIDLLDNHIVSDKYPGIVMPVGGDMFSGDIHEELSASNEEDMMVLFSDLFGVMSWVIEQFADHFGKIFIPWVAGNHSRTTKKVMAKGFNFTNFDFLLGLQLAKYFEKNKNVTFFIPNGSDAMFRIYNHTYLLTHGNQFRGGDGVIGAIGPVIRGDMRKRTRNNQIKMEYDTMLIGHFHQLMMLDRVIVNGSLKGYDEYAYTSNFPYEPPRQGLWITHPDLGITFSMPVLVDSVVEKEKPQSWVGWVE